MYVNDFPRAQQGLAGSAKVLMGSMTSFLMWTMCTGKDEVAHRGFSVNTKGRIFIKRPGGRKWEFLHLLPLIINTNTFIFRFLKLAELIIARAAPL